MNWRREFLLEMVEPSPLDKALEELAKTYHERTEAYDQRVCTGRYNGIAMPLDGEERKLMMSNANNELRSANKSGAEMGFSPEEVWAAIRKYRSR